ncbi:MAG: GspE/PulE family protein [Verrucomicrobiota bacterium]
MYTDNEDYVLEILQEAGHLTPDQIEDARSQRKDSESTVETLIRIAAINEESVTQSLAVNAGMDYVDISTYMPPAEILELLPVDKAKKYNIVPLGFDQNRLQVALSDPLDFEKIDTLPHDLGYDIDTVCATNSQIEEALLRYYGEEGGSDADLAEELRVLGDAADPEGQSGGGANDAPIIKLVNQILTDAFKAKASDIHIEPLEKEMRVRYRIDGVLHLIGTHPRKLLGAVIARLKIMSGSMKIAEKRVPQDGRIQLELKDKHLDLRVSSVPTNHGESIVMRILDKSALNLGLAQLGFLADDQERFEQLITLPDGILLVTGPTGSGKTTTLYACLNYINKPDRKIITVEDPVEYQMSGINQVMVKDDIGMTFGAALRSILRQAPNIIMIGEIRDLETASIAINASLTGHLVFSTLHTNDAPGAVARLADIGVKRFLIASAVRAIIAQRLVRGLCEHCKQPGELSEKEIRALNIDAKQLAEATIMAPVGCGRCRMTGMKGRMGLFETFIIDDEARHMINENLSTPALRRRARELGMRTLREDGIRKVLAGRTTAGEVLRVTMGDSN